MIMIYEVPYIYNALKRPQIFKNNWSLPNSKFEDELPNFADGENVNFLVGARDVNLNENLKYPFEPG